MASLISGDGPGFPDRSALANLQRIELGLLRSAARVVHLDVARLAYHLYGISPRSQPDMRVVREMRGLLDALEQHQTALRGWHVEFVYRSKRRTAVCRRAHTEPVTAASTA